jgi:uncharacterized protein (DUF1697 family)
MQRIKSRDNTALLRGVDVAGKNKLPIEDLAATFENLKLTNT